MKRAKCSMLKWKRNPGVPGIQAPLSYTKSYVISHRPREFVVSYRPRGKHVHVGTFTSIGAAKRAAVKHACRRR